MRRYSRDLHSITPPLIGILTSTCIFLFSHRLLPGRGLLRRINNGDKSLIIPVIFSCAFTFFLFAAYETTSREDQWQHPSVSPVSVSLPLGEPIPCHHQRKYLHESMMRANQTTSLGIFSQFLGPGYLIESQTVSRTLPFFACS